MTNVKISSTPAMALIHEPNSTHATRHHNLYLPRFYLGRQGSWLLFFWCEFFSNLHSHLLLSWISSLICQLVFQVLGAGLATTGLVTRGCREGMIL